MDTRFLIGSSLLFVAAAANAAEDGDGRPNVVVIYTDDMGIGDLSVYNNGWVETTNIDRLASQGIRLCSYYSAAPVSSPSRAAWMTGLFPLETGINTYLHTREANRLHEQRDFLPAEYMTIADVFKKSGYRTGHFGKWHLGGGRDVDNAPGIKEYGFDEYLSTYESPDAAPELTATNWIWSPQDEIKRWNRTGYFGEKAIEFMKADRTRPFYVNLWPDDMHTPWIPDVDAFENKLGWQSEEYFRRVLEDYDRQIGRFLERLEAEGLMENTIIIFTSDNGPFPDFERKRTTGYRGVKDCLHERGIRMPFIVRWDGVIAPGGVDSTSVVCAVDMIPTLAAMAGIALPEDLHVSGEDMSMALLGTPVERKGDLMWEYGRKEAFVRLGTPDNWSPHLCIRRGPWKLLMNGDGSSVELYNILEDPFETTDISSEKKMLVRRLSHKLIAWWKNRPIINNSSN